MASVIQDAIVIMLARNGELEGSEKFALMLNTSKYYLIKCARIVERNGEIQIFRSNGGRGHRTVYRRNRNQPGQPRRRKS